jgi:8-oxo-dGTP pyrophosphatase MutT (NUDIX family)
MGGRGVDWLRAGLARAHAPSSDFDLNPDTVLPAGRALRPAAVLLGITDEDAPKVLLTKRSSALRHHPGQIAFPGGKQDDADNDLTATALREAQEEVALPPSAAQVIGPLPPHETVTGFIVTPIVALIDPAAPLRTDPSEVDEAFFTPLSHVLKAQNYSIQSRRWRGRQRRYYTVPWGPYYIWGATARMLRVLADLCEGPR